jgi:cell division protein FtsZ
MSKTSYVPSPIKIKVIGVGGAGCNAVSHMIRERIRGVGFIVMDTDSSQLGATEALVHICLGEEVAQGQGAAGDHIIGLQAAEKTRDAIKEALAGANMIFLVAGMGGGTGTGAIPVVAEVAKEIGALTIAVVTKPFAFEGRRRIGVAGEGINQLATRVDALVIVPNDRLLEFSDNKASVDGAFKMSDEILCQAVQAISEAVTVPCMINLDFGDIRAIMKDAGPAHVSTGSGSGPNRCVDAAKKALDSPLMDAINLKKVKGVMFNVNGGKNLTLTEVSDAVRVIDEVVDPCAEIIFSATDVATTDDEVKLTLIVTRFN